MECGGKRMRTALSGLSAENLGLLFLGSLFCVECMQGDVTNVTWMSEADAGARDGMRFIRNVSPARLHMGTCVTNRRKETV